MKGEDFDKLIPIFNLIKHGEPDYDKLNEDFTWIHVKCDTSESWAPYYQLLDILKPNDSIRAQKTNGYGSTDVYILATSGYFEEVKEQIINAEAKSKFHNCYVIEEVHPGTNDIDFATIIQLMINSLGNNSMVDASNAQGRFFQIVKSETDKDLPDLVSKYIALEFKVDYAPSYLGDFSDIYLEYTVKTFNNALYDDIKGKEKLARFNYICGAGMQSSRYPYKDDGNTFVLKSRKFDEKTHLDMLNWTRSSTKSESEDTKKDVEKSLEESRAVHIFKLIEKLDIRYGDYFGGLSLCKREAERIPTELDPSYLERLMGHFREKTIHIDNKDRRKKGQDVIVCIYNLTESSNDSVVKDFVGIVKERYDLELTVTKGPKFGMYNLPVIHPKEFYKDDPDKDPHRDRSYTLMQHATVEGLKEAIKEYNKQRKANNTRYNNKKKKWLEEDPKRKEKDCPVEEPKLPNMPMAEVLFEQLYIKEEIESRTLNFYNWKEFGAEGNWMFAIPRFHSENHERILDGFAYFTIDKNGVMTEPVECVQYDMFAPSAFATLDWNDIEYAVVNSANQVNIVRSTNVNTIPDGDWVYKTIEMNKKNKLPRSHDVKSPDAKKEVFGGSIDIGYIRLTDTHWIYYVGQYNNLNQSIANSSVVREIEAVGKSKVFFEELFHMMSIPFVKHNQNSVIPFPIKYLKEWCKQLGYFKADVVDKKEKTE